MRIVPDSSMPVYEQVMEAIRGWIVDGRYPPGAALPAEETISRSLGVGLMAVRRALAELRHEGLISTRRGQPSTVRLGPARSFVVLDRGERVVCRMPTRSELRLH